jgi:hypothetical protein
MPFILLAVGVAVDVVLLLLGRADIRQPLSGVFGMLILGQFLTATGWIVIGDRAIKATLVVVVVGLLGQGLSSLSYGANGGQQHQGAITGVFYAGVYATIVNLPLLVARIRGWRMRLADKSLAAKSAGVAIRLYQISIREIMVYMLLVGLMGAIWSATRPEPPPGGSMEWNGNRFALQMYFAGAILLAFAPWSIWAAFCWLRPIHGGLMAMVATGCWGIVCLRLLDLDWTSTGLFLVPSLTMIVHLLTLQIAGYHWERRPDPPSTAPPDPGPDWDDAELWSKLGRPGEVKDSETARE